jgi:hypothetical protein
VLSVLPYGAKALPYGMVAAFTTVAATEVARNL